MRDETPSTNCTSDHENIVTQLPYINYNIQGCLAFISFRVILLMFHILLLAANRLMVHEQLSAGEACRTYH